MCTVKNNINSSRTTYIIIVPNYKHKYIVITYIVILITSVVILITYNY